MAHILGLGIALAIYIVYTVAILSGFIYAALLFFGDPAISGEALTAGAGAYWAVWIVIVVHKTIIMNQSVKVYLNGNES